MMISILIMELILLITLEALKEIIIITPSTMEMTVKGIQLGNLHNMGILKQMEILGIHMEIM